MSEIMKRICTVALAALLCVMLVMTLVACSTIPSDGDTSNSENNNNNPNGQPSGSQNGNQQDSQQGDQSGNQVSNTSSDRYSKYDLNASYDEAKSTVIKFTDSGATVSGGNGAKADGTTVTIGVAGTYILTGSCVDGRVIVEVAGTEKVKLVLSGLKLICKSSAPIWIKKADKTVITLADGTTNTLEDVGEYTDMNADGEPNACLFSKDDLTINGTGTLNVTSHYNNGICTKDDLKIISGTINVTAENHGVRGNDSVTIKDGVITISCKNDGIKSTKEDKEGKGYIYIEGGTITIDAGDDCLQASNSITAVGGKISADAGGKIVNCDGAVDIAKGVM